MPTTYPYRTTIRNEYLGVSKVIRAMTSQELDWLVESQLAKWAVQEEKRRQAEDVRQFATDLKLRAEVQSSATPRWSSSAHNIRTGSWGSFLNAVAADLAAGILTKAQAGELTAGATSCC
jgi:hypothetical protein